MKILHVAVVELRYVVEIVDYAINGFELAQKRTQTVLFVRFAAAAAINFNAKVSVKYR